MRDKIKWLSIIDYYQMQDEFDVYRFMHRDISINRCARAFVKKNKLNCSIQVKKQIFVDPGNDEGVYDSPSMKEARERIFNNAWNL